MSAAVSSAAERTFVRFTPRQRAEHVMVMSLFLILAFTGFPQKFPDTWAARVSVDFFGGLDAMRFWHRFAGFAFAFLSILHLAIAGAGVILGRMRPSIVPNKKDFTDAIQQMRYYLGTAPQPARFDRFDYRQKFEYWGLVLGGLVMIVTGVILFAPVLFATYLPGELIPAAKVAHSNEGLMAFLVVITWHIFNAHLSPEAFPWDPSIFTGRIPEHKLKHEHPLEWERLTGETIGSPEAESPQAGPAPEEPERKP